MSSEQMRIIRIPLAIFTMIVMIMVGIIGWIINDKLANIYTNITELKGDFKSFNNSQSDQEARLRVLEEKVTSIDSQNKNK